MKLLAVSVVCLCYMAATIQAAEPVSETSGGWVKYDKKAITTDSEVRIVFRAKRAAGGEAGTYNVPYFVSVTRHGAQKSYPTEAEFAAFGARLN